ncbi:HEAT repeat-containing protein 6 [Diachasma alloeum]|uniref:HEAT repeat-containing protein 6 n=1 Tax=Diachasma alloeum TaxID=454923 RepID=UPI0007384341|nr:HEAT repeat-containing protein 6 [Diachasma alloeum]
MESNSSVDHFHHNFMRITKELLTQTQQRVTDKTTIDFYLRELNILNYQMFIIEDDDTVKLLINRLCLNIQAQETSLVSNYCTFLTHLLPQVPPLAGRTLSTLKKWLHQCLEFSSFPALVPALLSLEKLVSVIPWESSLQDLDVLLSSEGLLPRFFTPSTPLDIQNLALTLLESLLEKKKERNSIFPLNHLMTIKNLVISILSSPPKDEDFAHLHHSRLILTSLNILTSLIVQGLLSKCPELPGEALGITQIYLFLGIAGVPLIKPEELHPAIMNLPERVHLPPRGMIRNPRPITKSKHNKKGKLSNKNEKQEKISMDLDKRRIIKSSDSETSDGEKCSQERSRRIQERIRYQALQVLHQVMRMMTSKKIFGFWSQIVTKSEKSGESRGLLRVVMKEPVSKIRGSALGVLTDAVVDARMFLVHADETEGSSFGTIFGTVGGMLREIHSALGFVLSGDGNLAVVTQALKCSAALVQVTPYGRMKEGLASKLARHCRYFVLHKDPTVRVVALSVFEGFANVENMTPEIVEILLRKAGDTNISKRLLQSPQITSPHPKSQAPSENDEEEIDSSNLEFSLNDPAAPATSERDSRTETRGDSRDSPFLVQICLNNISDKRIHVPVRLQSFKLLGALINCLEGIFKRLLDVEIVTSHLVEATSEPDPQVALHACRILEIISSKFSGIDSDSEGQNQLATFWNSIFPTVLRVSQSAETGLREVACDCFGTISNQVFTQLSLDKSIIIKTSLFGACRDPESAVRAAGLRALGMLINLCSLEEDTGFLEDLIDIVCTSLADENLGVRVKSAWALANLTDCLIKKVINNQLEPPLPLDLMLPNLYKTSVKAAQDNNKVKCNALRAVGNLVHLSQGKNLLGDIQLALDVLISSATSGNDMKVRWNACRALGFAISHHPDDIFPQNWKDEVIPALCHLICYSPNFKVRTNAAWALGSCKSYGKYVPFLWKSIVLALENSQHVPNFVEYTHRESLVQQLCLTLGHVAASTEPGDLQILWLDIKDHVEEIEVHIKSFQERALPEKTDDFVRARAILNNYSQTVSLHSNERIIAAVLGNLFNCRKHELL